MKEADDMKKVAFTTLGCKVNSYETEALWEIFRQKGYQRVSDTKAADVYIVNTCLVTNTAAGKSRQMIHRVLKHNPDADILVMGCLSQLEAEKVLAEKNVRAIVGTNDREKLLGYLDEYHEKGKKINGINRVENRRKFGNLAVSGYSDHQRAFLKIEDGCDNYCSYCIIPYARGPVRSKPLDEVMEEAEILAKSHQEIILTGIHTGGYGKDIEDVTFATLLWKLAGDNNLPRIRISSIEIHELTDEVIEILSGSKRFVHHLHIPLQSGSDKILKLMNRKYDTAYYKDRINKIRKALPDLSVTTDIIVGFPKETEADFVDTLTFAEMIGFNELHVFPYSKRPGTVAAKMTDDIPGNIKKERVGRLIALGEKMAKDAIKAMIGKKLEVIVERRQGDYLTGHSAGYIHVAFKGSDDLIGRKVDVILDREAYPLSVGSLVNK